MQAQPGIMSPEGYRIRDPRDPDQKNGRVVNPKRMQTLGGFTGPSKWATTSEYAVEHPTGVKVAKRAYEKKLSK